MSPTTIAYSYLEKICANICYCSNKIVQRLQLAWEEGDLKWLMLGYRSWDVYSCGGFYSERVVNRFHSRRSLRRIDWFNSLSTKIGWIFRFWQLTENLIVNCSEVNRQVITQQWNKSRTTLRKNHSPWTNWQVPPWLSGELRVPRPGAIN